jgi:hypothetical protein
MKMIEVKSRSTNSWGPLAKIDEAEFIRIVNNRKGNTKNLIKRSKKLKTYSVQFKKVWQSDTFEIQAEDDYSLSTAAKQYFKQNEQSISFKEQTRNQWADGYAGYDTISFVKVK